MNTTDRSPPLEPDDPRISEWIDGRLPTAEAVAIERAVRASPQLAALVADLRAIKEAARAISAGVAPAGLSERVMARLAESQTADDADSDRSVDHEWEALEAERIAVERAEAAADLAEKGREPMRNRWPWMALVGALAAGLLVTVVLNLPGDGNREVALAPAPAAADLTESDLVAATADLAVAALDERPAPTARSLAAAKQGAPPPQATVVAAPPAAEAASMKSLGREPVNSGPLGKVTADKREALADVVPVTVRGPAGRLAFEQRAAALGLALTGLDEGVTSGQADALPRQKASARQSRQNRPEIIAISGPADAIATLLTEMSQKADRNRSASVTRVLVRLIELPAPAVPQPAEPARAEPLAPAGAEP
jgi:hypothetical protein